MVTPANGERNLDPGARLILGELRDVKTLNHHTGILERHGQILERIEHTLVAWATGRPEQGNGGDASPES